MNVEDLQSAEGEEQNELPVADELATLKARAAVMGIKHHPTIGADALRAKISARLNDQPDPEDVAAQAAPAKPASTTLVKPEEETVESAGQKRARLKREANEMVRIVVSCKNPAKKEWQGEIFTTGNAAVGTFKKFVPFDAEEGWHVPRIIYNMIKGRECQIFVENNVTIAGRVQKVRKGKIIKEFAVEVLPPLTKDELKALSQRQLMASGAPV